MHYEFKNAAGQICCSTDNPEYLCGACKTKAKTGDTVIRRNAEEQRTLRAAADAWRAYFAETPDPFAAPIEARREARGAVVLTAVDDPNYKPYGRPADGFALGIASRRLQREVKAEQTRQPQREPRVGMLRDSNGTPDGYASALANRRAGR